MGYGEFVCSILNPHQRLTHRLLTWIVIQALRTAAVFGHNKRIQQIIYAYCFVCSLKHPLQQTFLRFLQAQIIVLAGITIKLSVSAQCKSYLLSS